MEQTGAERWVYIYNHGAKRREMSLGFTLSVAHSGGGPGWRSREAPPELEALPIDERRLASASVVEQIFPVVASDLLDDLEKG